jgi:hypothetical protein
VFSRRFIDRLLVDDQHDGASLQAFEAASTWL